MLDVKPFVCFHPIGLTFGIVGLVMTNIPIETSLGLYEKSSYSHKPHEKQINLTGLLESLSSQLLEFTLTRIQN